MQQATGFFFPSEDAQAAADLVGIEFDLKAVIFAVRMILRTPDVPENLDLRSALMDSAFIRYRRCFAKGLRRALRRTDVQSCAAEFVDVHDYFFSLSNKHIAHSVNVLEMAAPVVFLAEGDAEPKVVGISIQHLTAIENDTNLRNLERLADALLELFVRKEIARLQAIFEAQVGKASPAKLRALRPADFPVNPAADVVGRDRPKFSA